MHANSQAAEAVYAADSTKYIKFKAALADKALQGVLQFADEIGINKLAVSDRIEMASMLISSGQTDKGCQLVSSLHPGYFIRGASPSLFLQQTIAPFTTKCPAQIKELSGKVKQLDKQINSTDSLRRWRNMYLLDQSIRGNVATGYEWVRHLSAKQKDSFNKALIAKFREGVARLNGLARIQNSWQLC